MIRRLIPITLLLLTLAVIAQEADLSGSWEVFQVSSVSRYSLREHLSSETPARACDMVLNSDGTINATVPNLTVHK